MRRYFHDAMIVAVLTAGHFVAHSQEKLSLSIEKSIELGLQNSKTLHASQMKLQAAGARSEEAGAARLPSLKFGASYTRLSDIPPFAPVIPAGTLSPQQPPISITLSPVVLNNYNLRFTLQQPLFTGFRLESNSDIASLSAEAAQADLSRDEADVVYTIRNAYWSFYKANEFRKVLDENVEQVKAHLDDVRHLMNQGMATTNDVLRVQVQLSNTELLQIDAKNNVHLAMLGLNNVIGLPLMTETQMTSVPDSSLKAGEADVAALVAQAIGARPELRGMQYRVEAGESGVRLAKSGWYPQVYLTGNYYYARPNPRILPAEDRFRDTWDIGIMASMDIWNWGTTVHQTQQAQAQLAQAEDAFSLLRDAITLEVTQNYLTLNQSVERIGVAKQAVGQAEENYRVTNEKFNMGLSLNSDVLDAEASLLQAKWTHIQALVEYELADARLKKSVGRPAQENTSK